MEKTVERIKVAIRCRPLTTKEKKGNEKEIIYVDQKRNEVIIKEPDNKKKPNVFTYDHVYGMNSAQEEIYKDCGKPIVDYLFEGFNCTIFAYGQTGTGKTFTMEGGSQELQRGIIPRTFQEIFTAINNAPQNVEYLVRVSMLELYNEKLKDSLSPEVKDNRFLEIHGDTEKGFFVKNLEEFNVTNVKELEKKLEYGKANRQVRATEMNDYSSRSHSIFSIIIESSKTDEDGNKSFRIGKLNMVDLAGSEKQKKTQTSDEALKEGIKINLSLSNLINVINLLVKGASHIPYRNSLLTKLLADSLGGNSKTIMIANIGPAGSNYSETLQTLKYANRAKQIKNKPKINEDSKDALLRQKQEELEMLKLQIQKMGMGNTQILKTMKSVGSNNDRKESYKENIDCKTGKVRQHQSNEQISSNEKARLQKQLTFQQQKVKQQETEKQKLIQKYNAMCNDIITHHDYQKDINSAKEELNKLNSDNTYQKNYLKTKQLLAEKKQHLNKMDKKSKKVQEAIQSYNKKIIQSREKIADIKQNKNDIKQQLQRKVENLSKRLSQNRILLKQQHFYLHNLIPENFTKMMEQKFLNLHQNSISSYSLLDLEKPISTTYYSLLDSFQNSYLNKIRLKQKQIEYPNDSDLYSNNFLSDPSLDSQFLNLQYFSMENGDLFNVKTNSIENLNQLICGKFIMDQDLITHLSTNAFKTLQDNASKTLTMILQISTMPEPLNNSTKFQKLKLSDGYFVQDVIVPPPSNFIKVANIIQAQLMYKNNMYAMLNSKLVYECDQQIGIPKPYNYHEQNTTGSNNIPQNIIKKSEQKRQNSKGQLHQGIVQKARNVDLGYFTEIGMIDSQTREFRIRGRLQQKSPLKEFRNKKGWLFDCSVQDKSGCIKLTFFNDMATKFFDKLIIGNVYAIQDGKVTIAHPKYNKTGHSQEIHVNNRTQIEELPDQNEMPQQKFNIVKIEDIEDIEQSKYVDILVVVAKMFPVETRTIKSGDQMNMQNIIVKDDTAQIQVTFWGDSTLKLLDVSNGDYLILKDLQVKQYGGKTLAFSYNSILSKDIPDIPQYKEVLRIKDQPNDNLVKNLSKQKDFSQYNMSFKSFENIVQETSLLDTDEKRKFRAMGFITFIPFSRPFFYLSCPSEKCLKKIDNQGGVYFCAKCNQTFDKFHPRFLATLSISDSTRSLKILVGGSQACQMIFGMKEQELYEKTSALPENERQAFALKYCNQEISLKVNCTRQEYQGTMYNKYSAEDVKLINGVSTFLTTMLFKEIKNQMDHMKL